MNEIYSPPQSELKDVAELDSELASRWSRLFAAMIDGLIGMAVTIPTMMYLGYWEAAIQNVAPPLKITLLMGLSGFIFYIAIHGYFLAKNGQSVGKKLLGIRIVNLDNQTLTLGELLGKRYLPVACASLIPIVGQYLVSIESLFIFRRDKRCVHDLIAGTKVVKI